MYITAFNPGDSPVVVSEDGRVIGGHEWGVIQTTDDAAQSALENGYITKVDPPEDQSTINPEAKFVFERVEKWSGKHDKLQKVDKDVLIDDARQRGLIGEDEEPTKSDLVRLYTENEMLEVPSKKAVRENAPTAVTPKKEG